MTSQHPCQRPDRRGRRAETDQHQGTLGIGAQLSSEHHHHEVWYRIGSPGFRTHQSTLVTTLLSPEVCRVIDLAELYRQRRQVETSLAQIKTTMQMDVLHGKTVSGVLKELTVFAISIKTDDEPGGPGHVWFNMYESQENQ